MESYTSIAIQYLKLNKRRTILTILGSALTVFILYILLNAGFSVMDDRKQTVIENGDYEMILYTETPEQVQEILNDPVVKRAYVNKWYLASEEKELEQALFVTGDNPYRIDKNFQYLTTTYGLNGKINQELAAFYFQGNDSNAIYVTMLFFFLVSYLFALFGVGVIRNSIQLSLFEQIKDYGNLRCIGATVGQLRAIIYLQGLIMEMAGMVIGIVIGQIVLWIAGIFINFDMAMHIIPIVFIMIAYLGDMYFAMEENCKLVTGMSPVSALKGEFQIKKEKFKRRKKSIYGRLLGVDGDYAYKNLMRSPGRFFKSVGAIFIGITALTACFGIIDICGEYIIGVNERYGYYQIYYKADVGLGNTLDEMQKNIPSTEKLEAVKNADAVTGVKRVYESELIVADDEAFYSHLDETYLNETNRGDMYKHFTEKSKEIAEKEAEGEVLSDIDTIKYHWQSIIACYGYDEEDYARYEEYLTEGTLDTSDNGIVIVNGTNTPSKDIESLNVEYVDTKMTTYKVGDTIDIVNPEKLEKMVIERVQAAKQKAREEAATEEDGESDFEEVKVGDGELGVGVRSAIILECREELLAQGEYNSYVVEGIVEKDANIISEIPTIILPLEKYYKMTGKDEKAVTGMSYHVEGNLNSAALNTMWFWEDGKYYQESTYIMDQEIFVLASNWAKYVLIFALFLVTVSSVNIINTTASNIRLRRKEFA